MLLTSLPIHLAAENLGWIAEIAVFIVILLGVLLMGAFKYHTSTSASY